MADLKVHITILLLSFFFLSTCFSQRIQPGAEKKKAVVEEEIIVDSAYYVNFSNIDSRFELGNKINETSGLLFFRDGFLTHNDSQGEPVLYKVDSANGTIVQKIRLSNAKNKDWEDIAQDEEYIYIGDFGNNFGERRDLVIYKISKEDIPENGDISLEAEKIKFSFNDQKSFNNVDRLHNYDCESVIAFGDSLYLFSKDWVDWRTRLYRLPKEAGTYKAEVIDEFNARGLVTAADIGPKGKRLVLVGYFYFTPFVWTFTGFKGSDFFSGHATRIDLPHIYGAQTEGVAYLDTARIIISSEATKKLPQQIFDFRTYYWEAEILSDYSDPVIDDAWSVTTVGNKKKGEFYFAVDVSGLKDLPSVSWLETKRGKLMGVPGFHFEKHMGKVYLKYDIRHLKLAEYKVQIRSGSSYSEKKLFNQ